MQRFVRCSVLMCALLAVIVARPVNGLGRADTPDKEAPLGAQAVRDDPRLANPLTYDADHLYLGELLERISKQTGVSVSIAATDPASGIRLTCHVKGLPLKDFLNGIQSTVSLAEAPWKIEIAGTGAARTYRLVPTPQVHAAEQRLRKESEADTDRALAVFTKIQAVPQPERAQFLPELTQALLQDSPVALQHYVDDAPHTRDFWDRFGLYVTELTPEQKAKLRQGISLTIPVSSLTPAHQAMLKVWEENHHHTENGVPVTNYPDRVQFTIARQFPERHSLAPDLVIGTGTANSMMSLNTFGLMEFALEKALVKRWLQPTDVASLPLEKQQIADLPPLPKEGDWQQAAQVDRMLTQFADAHKYSYIGVLPDYHKSSSFHSSVAPSLDSTLSQGELIHKWHDGLLLCNTAASFYGDEPTYPYAFVKRLRESRRNHTSRRLTFPEVAEIVGALDDAQLERLTEEFEEVDQVGRRPLFLFYQRYPDVMEAEGVPANAAMLAMLDAVKKEPFGDGQAPVERIRLRRVIFAQLPDYLHLYWLEFRVAEKWVRVADLTIASERRVSGR